MNSLWRTCVLASTVLVAGACVEDSAARRARALRDDVADLHARSDGDNGAATAAPAPVVFDDARSMTIHLLDVGQGAATLLEFPCGAVLVDTGGESNAQFDAVAKLQAQLDAFFVRRADLNRTLDTVFITHPHIDHLRGLPMVLSTYTVKNVVDDGLPGDEIVREPMGFLAEWLRDHPKVGHRAITNADITKKSGLTDDVIDPIRCSDVDPTLRVLSGGLQRDPGWGTDNHGKLLFDNMNNQSLVLRVDVGNASLLITGDLEEIAIRDLIARYHGTRWLDVDVYQAGHHGSANGTTLALMEATTPLVALIAMGAPERHLDWTAWTYGHPRAKAVDLLESGVGLTRDHKVVQVATGTKRFTRRPMDRAVYGTGWDGAVDVQMSVDGHVQVHAGPDGRLAQMEQEATH